MLNLESKSGIAKGSQEKVYNYLSDFRNFAHMFPKERLSGLEITEHTCRFGIEGLGRVGLKIAEKNPFSQIKISATEDSTSDFTFQIIISGSAENQSQVQITLQAKLNMFLEMMAKGPLQQFIDMIVDKLSEVRFDVLN
jgi:carbon monoxide dehydrogenase subunit G